MMDVLDIIQAQYSVVAPGYELYQGTVRAVGAEDPAFLWRTQGGSLHPTVDGLERMCLWMHGEQDTRWVEVKRRLRLVTAWNCRDKLKSALERVRMRWRLKVWRERMKRVLTPNLLWRTMSLPASSLFSCEIPQGNGFWMTPAQLEMLRADDIWAKIEEFQKREIEIIKNLSSSPAKTLRSRGSEPEGVKLLRRAASVAQRRLQAEHDEESSTSNVGLSEASLDVLEERLRRSLPSLFQTRVGRAPVATVSDRVPTISQNTQEERTMELPETAASEIREPTVLEEVQNGKMERAASVLEKRHTLVRMQVARRVAAPSAQKSQFMDFVKALQQGRPR
jgi:hypothetical protein